VAARYATTLAKPLEDPLRKPNFTFSNMFIKVRKRTLSVR
jgi:hypothetical protein